MHYTTFNIASIYSRVENKSLPNIRNMTTGVLQPIAMTIYVSHGDFTATVRYTEVVRDAPMERQAMTVSQWLHSTWLALKSSCSLFAQMKPKTTTIEVSIARVLAMMNTLNAIRCPRTAVPSCWSYPPGMVNVEERR